MLRSKKLFTILGLIVLAVGLLFGSALADPGDRPLGEEGGTGWGMHTQMDPESYGLMIQRMTEIHGAEFTAEMLQNMNEGGGCHAAGQQGTMGAAMMNDGGMEWGLEGMMFALAGGMHSLFSDVGDMMGAGTMGGGMMGGGMGRR